MKSKGFTLIELLAVIVILAILILAAAPNVVKIVNNSTKNVFSNETKTMLNAFNMAYQAALEKKVTTAQDLRNKNHYTYLEDYTLEDYKNYKSAKVLIKSKIDIGGKERDTYMFCMTLQDLVDDGYLKKELSDYTGEIVSFTLNDGSIWYYVMMANKTNYFNYTAGGNKVYLEEAGQSGSENHGYNNSCMVWENTLVFDLDSTLRGKGITVPNF